MSKTATRALHLPHMRANPFSSRPIEASDYTLLVGRGDLMSDFRHHLCFGSPRKMILLGERGSGRTSILQALSKLSPNTYPFTYYPDENPGEKLLNEMYCLIAGYDVPSSTNTLVEQMVSALDGRSGELPLITFDFPGVSGSDLAQVFERLTPTLSRLRALVIVALTPAQLAAWSDDLQDEFDITVPLPDFDAATVKSLIRTRISKVSNSDWSIPPSFIDDAMAQTGGRPADLIRHLRDMVDSERGASTAFSRKQEMLESMDLEPNDARSRMPPEVVPLESLDEEIESEPPSELDPETEPEPEPEHEPEIDFHWDIPEMDPEPEPEFPEEPVEEIIEEELEDEPDFELPSLEVDDGEEPDMSQALGGSVLEMEPGTEPPTSTHSFGGLAARHRSASVEIGLENALRPQASGPMTAKPDTTMHLPSEEPQLESEETTYWVADSLPDPEPTPVMDPIAAKEIGDKLRQDRPKPAATTFALDFEKVSSLNDGEVSIVETSISREISPSDTALQALLAVGRPRLSQIFNGLHKAGILTVRKKGRTRLFRISDQAKAHFSDGHMEV